MDGKIDIYCEFGFLKRFCDEREVITNENLKMWVKYLELLEGKCDIILDIERKDFAAHCDESMSGQILMLLLAPYADGSEKLRFWPEIKKELEISEKEEDGSEFFAPHEHTIFMMDRDKTECKRLEEDYGLLFISKDNFYEYKFLFISDIQEINATSNFWESVKLYKHPCNKITLVDKFIVNETDEVIKENLNSLFDSIMPLTLNKIDFKILIYTKDDFDKKKNDKKEKLIKDCISSIRTYQKPIDIDIVWERKPEHDRSLFTNYGFFECGYGFVLTESQRASGTRISFDTITNHNVYKIVRNFKEKKKQK